MITLICFACRQRLSRSRSHGHTRYCQSPCRTLNLVARRYTSTHASSPSTPSPSLQNRLVMNEQRLVGRTVLPSGVVPECSLPSCRHWRASGHPRVHFKRSGVLRCVARAAMSPEEPSTFETHQVEPALVTRRPSLRASARDRQRLFGRDVLLPQNSQASATSCL